MKKHIKTDKQTTGTRISKLNLYIHKIDVIKVYWKKGKTISCNRFNGTLKCMRFLCILLLISDPRKITKQLSYIVILAYRNKSYREFGDALTSLFGNAVNNNQYKRYPFKSTFL